MKLFVPPPQNNPKPALVSADMSSELVSNGLDGNVLDQIKTFLAMQR